MIEKIQLHAIWRYGTGHYHAGVYRVPQDMPRHMAEAAVRDGRAHVVAGRAPAEHEANDAPDKAEIKPPPRKRKGPAPENKAAKPDEDKAAPAAPSEAGADAES